MKEYIINDIKYKIIKDDDNIFDKSLMDEMYTDYFEPYDYILGDIAYSHLRLKGFNNKENPNYKPLNDYAKIDEYIKNKCAYGCKYFILEKVK